VQFIAQAVGLILLKRARTKVDFPYKMPLFPLPVYLAILMWGGILLATGLTLVVGGLIVISTGAVVYLVKAKLQKDWPFHTKDTVSEQ